MKIIKAQAEQLAFVRDLFNEYQEALNEDLCFQGFENELASLPGCYASPKGIIYLAFAKGDYTNSADAIGCVAIRSREGKISEAELKRLYVRQRKRSKGTGKQLLNNAILFAKGMQYSSLFLETLPSMTSAKPLYESYGFEQTNNPGLAKDSKIECYQYLFKQDAEED